MTDDGRAGGRTAADDVASRIDRTHARVAGFQSFSIEDNVNLAVAGSCGAADASDGRWEGCPSCGGVLTEASETKHMKEV